MAKILLVATVDQHIRHFHLPLIQRLVDEGNEVHIAANGKEKFKDVSQKFNLPFQRNPFSIDNFRAYKQLSQIIQDNHYDLVHVNTPVGSVVGRLAAKRRGKFQPKTVYTAHGFHFYKGASKKNWLLFYPVEKILLRKTDALITMNDEDYTRAKKMAKKNSALIIEKIDGVGIDLTHETLSQEVLDTLKEQYSLTGSKIITYVAELSKRKNQTELIEAFDQVVKKNGDIFKLLLIGDGPMQNELVQLIQSKGLEKQIILAGYQNNVDSFLQITDVLVSSSKQEGLPVNILEGMVYGLPIVASSIRGHVDLLEEYPNGKLYQLGRVDELSESIAEASSEHSAIYEMNKFSVVTIVDETVNLYKRTMK